MKPSLPLICFLTLVTFHSNAQITPEANKAVELKVKHTQDFKVTGKGDAAPWKTTDWVIMPQRKMDGEKYETKVKLLYSDSGVYSLFRCEDKKITSTLREDFTSLFREDVVEIFFWPDESTPIYFEYELSPHNYELAILVPNINGSFQGWRPWNYRGDKVTRRATSIDGEGWTAEFFIPYPLLRPLANVPAKKGMKWRANMYRIDYDSGMSTWTWQPIVNNFHDFQLYGTLVFD